MKDKNSILIEYFFSKAENKSLLLFKEVFLIFSFAVLTGIFAQIKVEIGPVPITMQTLAVLLSGVILGAKRGAVSQFTYLLFGLLGIPWFSRGGGLIYILSPTFGYIVGFVLAAFVVGFFCERGWGKSLKGLIAAMTIGNFLLYIPGLIYLARFVDFRSILAVGFYPFILGDFFKIFFASLIFCFLFTSKSKRNDSKIF